MYSPRPCLIESAFYALQNTLPVPYKATAPDYSEAVAFIR